MDDKVSIWNTKQSDVTVGDQVKIGVVTAVICTVVSAAVLAGISGGATLWEKHKDAKAKKNQETTEETA